MSNGEMQLLNDIMGLATNGLVQAKLAELMGILRKSVDSDVQARLELLEKENAELRGYKDTAEEVQRRTRELDTAIANAKCEAKRMRLKQLVKPFMESAWYVWGADEYVQEKCGECDENRKRHFTSPMGKEMTEDCWCAEKRFMYRLKRIGIVKMKYDGGDRAWYYFTLPTAEQDALQEARVYKGEIFAEVHWRVIFLDESKAQEYADWLNSKGA